MKERILTGWTFTRILYIVIGSFVIVQSIISHQWLGIVFGGYFAAMGLFAFGCASGNCNAGSCNPVPPQFSKDKIQDVEFEEIKDK